VEIEIGQRAAIARLTLPDERRLVASRPADVAIEAVRARVDRPADEPFRVRRLPVEHRGPWPEPLELAGESGPERFGIALRLRVDAFVARHGLRTKSGGWRKRSVFAKKVGEFCERFGIGHAADSIQKGLGAFHR